jgi:hypothetical protein
MGILYKGVNMQTIIYLLSSIFIGLGLYNLGYNNGIKYCTERLETLVKEHKLNKK